MEDDPFQSSDESDAGRPEPAAAGSVPVDEEGKVLMGEAEQREGEEAEVDEAPQEKRRRTEPQEGNEEGVADLENGPPNEPEALPEPPTLLFTLPVVPPQRYSLPTELVQGTQGKVQLLETLQASEDDGVDHWGTLCPQIMRGNACVAGPKCGYLHISREGWRQKQLWLPTRRLPKSQGLPGAEVGAPVQVERPPPMERSAPTERPPPAERPDRLADAPEKGSSNEPQAFKPALKEISWP
eukprot:GGOE01049455.1.p1 GENE.GGOE01049455.1~~GGOE01049455.1.p1  ORF type:complete len:261 (-),score=68.43 GGOE01049455.1:293-1012(-)